MLSFDLAAGSPWAALEQRFSKLGVGAEATISDRDAGSGLRLLLHRTPDATAPAEVGFFLQDPGSDLVEISPGPATTRESLAAAWDVATALGLIPVRLAPGEGSLLARLAELGNRADSGPEAAALLVVAAGEALESGITGSAELDLLLARVWPGPRTVFDELNSLTHQRRTQLLDGARVQRGLAHLPASLRRELRSGAHLAERRVELEFEGGLARIRTVRPRSLNALDPEMLQELDATWAQAEADPRTRAIVLEATGPAFMAGVDLSRILVWMESDRLDLVEDFVRAAHRFLHRIDRCPHHTLVRLHGLAVGAGAEICAAFDTVVATPQGSVGFPEISIGIYPAMGGTQRLPRKIGLAAARWWILESALLPAWRAARLGLVDSVVDETELDREVLRLAFRPPSGNRAGLRERADTGPGDAGLGYFATAILEEILEPLPTAPIAALRLARELRRRSQVAVRTADTLLLLSGKVPLAAGLAAEIEGLQRVFPTAEALRGIRAALHRTRRSRSS